MRHRLVIGALVAVVAIVGLALLFWPKRMAEPPPPPAAGPTIDEPVVEHPLPPPPVEAPAAPLPALADSDAFMSAALSELIGAQPARYDEIVGGYLDRGYALAMDALVGVGGRAAYVDTFNDLGGYIEIIEMLPVVESLFNMVYQASVGWDGKDPVRRLG